MRGSLEFLGGRRMMDESGGLNPSAVATIDRMSAARMKEREGSVPGSPSVTRLTKRSWTGMRASGIPSRTVKKILQPTRYQSSPSEEGRRKWDEPDDFSNVGRNEVSNELLRVLVDRSSFLDGSFDTCKVVVGEDHVGRELGDVRSRTHGDTDSSSRESWCIIHTITSLH